MLKQGFFQQTNFVLLLFHFVNAEQFVLLQLFECLHFLLHFVGQFGWVEFECLHFLLHLFGWGEDAEFAAVVSAVLFWHIYGRQDCNKA